MLLLHVINLQLIFLMACQLLVLCIVRRREGRHSVVGLRVYCLACGSCTQVMVILCGREALIKKTHAHGGGAQKAYPMVPWPIIT